jgi:hypothetical protein
MTDEQRVDAVRTWFAERGFELVVHPVEHGGYFAPWMSVESRGGTAPFTWGKTALDAAEAAQAQCEADQQRQP